MKIIPHVFLTGVFSLSAAVATPYQDALSAYNQGKTDQALKLALNLKSAEGYTLAARSLLTEVTFKKLDPEQSGPHLEQAEAYIAKALDMNPNSALAYYQLSGIKGTQLLQGGLLDQLGGAREVKRLLLKALELDPNLAQAHSMLGVWHATGSMAGLIASTALGASEQEALSASQKAVDLAPTSISMRLNHASVLLMLAQKNKRLTKKYQVQAKAELQQVAKLRPESVYEEASQKTAQTLLQSLK
ncbi:hypothetical protein [Deinococcus cellulosilyticus]|uniref:Tetratricopeptide repeat protein n=1 Tax=Deinococcus cellulosilyticus (strain DSM 18568 / NBRC 106333 / KACC 11606 / 5516J-15) TaxID=1223518 RepID=A0A511N1D4_DEIC1|nr:hypothetical protein [Deinococcus cellulosilyticus]GEM46261.1 hypothetical protein DC3_18960 [Deinococcus cellulosilyticus NBRC 106333 = KACC 11606]